MFKSVNKYDVDPLRRPRPVSSEFDEEVASERTLHPNPRNPAALPTREYGSSGSLLISDEQRRRFLERQFFQANSPGNSPIDRTPPSRVDHGQYPTSPAVERPSSYSKYDTYHYERESLIDPEVENYYYVEDDHSESSGPVIHQGRHLAPSPKHAQIQQQEPSPVSPVSSGHQYLHGNDNDVMDPEIRHLTSSLKHVQIQQQEPSPVSPVSSGHRDLHGNDDVMNPEVRRTQPDGDHQRSRSPAPQQYTNAPPRTHSRSNSSVQDFIPPRTGNVSPIPVRYERQQQHQSMHGEICFAALPSSSGSPLPRSSSRGAASTPIHRDQQSPSSWNQPDRHPSQRQYPPSSLSTPRTSSRQPPLTPLVIPPTPIRSSSSPIVNPSNVSRGFSPSTYSPSPSLSSSNPQSPATSSNCSPVTVSTCSPLTPSTIPTGNSHSAPLQKKPARKEKDEFMPTNDSEANVAKAIKFHEEGKLEEAAKHFKLAAELDSPLGMFLYGISLRHGWGCSANPHLAFQYLQKSAEFAVVDLNNLQAVNTSVTKGELVMAIYELGVSFRHGWGVPKNKVTAAYYFEIAANLGDPDAQNDLAHCYYHGHGVKKDMFKAAKYYRLAAAQGHGIMGNSWIFKKKYDSVA